MNDTKRELRVCIPKSEYDALVAAAEESESMRMLDPDELGRKMNPAISGKEVNAILQAHGYQFCTFYGWEPTASGVSHCSRHEKVPGENYGHLLRWRFCWAMKVLGHNNYDSEV